MNIRAILSLRTAIGRCGIAWGARGVVAVQPARGERHAHSLADAARVPGRERSEPQGEVANAIARSRRCCAAEDAISPGSCSTRRACRSSSAASTRSHGRSRAAPPSPTARSRNAWATPRSRARGPGTGPKPVRAGGALPSRAGGERADRGFSAQGGAGLKARMLLAERARVGMRRRCSTSPDACAPALDSLRRRSIPRRPACATAGTRRSRAPARPCSRRCLRSLRSARGSGSRSAARGPGCACRQQPPPQDERGRLGPRRPSRPSARRSVIANPAAVGIQPTLPKIAGTSARIIAVSTSSSRLPMRTSPGCSRAASAGRQARSVAPSASGSSCAKNTCRPMCNGVTAKSR